MCRHDLERDMAIIFRDMICKMEKEYSETISDIEKYAEDPEQLNNLRMENYYFKTNWRELGAELPTLRQKHYQTRTYSTSSNAMVISSLQRVQRNRGCGGDTHTSYFIETRGNAEVRLHYAR